MSPTAVKLAHVVEPVKEAGWAGEERATPARSEPELPAALLITA